MERLTILMRRPMAAFKISNGTLNNNSRRMADIPRRLITCPRCAFSRQVGRCQVYTLPCTYSLGDVCGRLKIDQHFAERQELTVIPYISSELHS